MTDTEMTMTDLTNKYDCPNCRNQKAHQYSEIPKHHRHYVLPNGEHVTEHMPQIRDYECTNCGFLWALDPEQEC